MKGHVKDGCKGFSKQLGKKRKLKERNQIQTQIQEHCCRTLEWSWIPYALCMVGAPMIFVNIVQKLLASKSVNTTRDLMWVEYFAGKRAVTKAQWMSGRLAVAFELLDDEVWGNILTAEGYLYAITLALKVAPEGGGLAAIVCSSWVFLSMSSTGRAVSCLTI